MSQTAQSSLLLLQEHVFFGQLHARRADGNLERPAFGGCRAHETAQLNHALEGFDADLSAGSSKRPFILAVTTESSTYSPAPHGLVWMRNPSPGSTQRGNGKLTGSIGQVFSYGL